MYQALVIIGFFVGFWVIGLLTPWFRRVTKNWDDTWKEIAEFLIIGGFVALVGFLLSF